MFVSKLKVTGLALLGAIAVSGKTLDANYNPIFKDTVYVSGALTQLEHQASDEALMLSLCDLQPQRTYRISIGKSVADCYPLIELFEQASPLALRQWRDQMRSNLPDNTRFSFIATQACMDLLIDRGDCPSGSHFQIELAADSPSRERGGLLRNAGIETDEFYTPQSLVEDVLVGGGCFDIVPGSISAIGNPRGIGYFQGGQNAIGIEEGVILATGEIDNAEGPNTYDATSGYLGISGEEDLELLLPNAFVYDASGLEFSFIPTTDRIEFRYVFASEEYCEFVGSRFNDVFGFFIQGPGINGGFTGNGENIALIPGTNDRVSINAVNHIINRNYYVKNETLEDAIDCFTPFSPTAITEIEYDGFTVVLTATAEVVPCETYHIKLVVADVSDRRLDSAVFLEANSFEAGGQALVSTDVPYSPINQAFESCKESFFLFQRAGEDVDKDIAVRFHLSEMSTATVGEDFAPLPDSVIIPAGATEVYLPVDIFEDAIVEGAESIVIELENPCSCETPFTLMNIADKPPLTALALDEVICKAEEVNLVVTPSGGVAPYAYEWSTGDSSSAILVNPETTTTYEVLITDFCGEQVTETASVQVLLEPAAELAGVSQICPEHPLTSLPVSLSGSGPFSLVYAINGVTQPPVTGIADNDFELPAAQVGQYTLISMADNGCPGPATGQAEIVATEMSLAAETTPVTCFDRTDGTVDITLTGNGVAPFTYSWSHGSAEEDPTGLAINNYSVVVSDADGCTTALELEVILDPGVPEVVAAVDKVLTCTETAINLDGSGSSTGDLYQYAWMTSEGRIVSGNQSMSAIVDQPGAYTLEVTNSKTDCSISQTITVEADVEAPQVALNVLSAQSVIDCNVSSIVLDGSANEAISTLEFAWSSFNGRILSGGRTPNPEVDRGGVYQLQVTNLRNGCVTTEEILIETDTEIPKIIIDEPELLTCVQTEVRIDAGASDQGNQYRYQWTSPNGSPIGNGNSLLPVVAAPGDYQLQITNGNNGCENSETIEVRADVTPPEVVIEAPEEIICDRPVVELDASGSSSGSQFSYRWSTQEGKLVAATDQPLSAASEGGVYLLQITNQENGCVGLGEIEVSENTNRPSAAEIMPTPPRCYGENGSIAIGNITGGEGPFVYSFDGGANFSSQSVHPLLPAGDYQVAVMDINGCIYEEAVTIPQTFQMIVDLAPEVTIELGDDFQIDATVNIPGSNIADISWSTTDSMSCTNCLRPVVSPIQNTEYRVLVRDKNGCEATAQTLLRINRTPFVYIPNVFSPNNQDGINDKFVVFAKEKSVKQVKTFQVFNRWGAKLFEANNFAPNDQTFGWDGRSQGKRLTPAVFVYFVEIEFIDGRTEMFKGDVVLIK